MYITICSVGWRLGKEDDGVVLSTTWVYTTKVYYYLINVRTPKPRRLILTALCIRLAHAHQWRYNNAIRSPTVSFV